MGLTVLSLCDGISTGQQVLKELNIEVDKYFSSEIEKSAMTVTQYHFPNTIQVGDIFKVSYKDGILYTASLMILITLANYFNLGVYIQDFQKVFIDYIIFGIVVCIIHMISDKISVYITSNLILNSLKEKKPLSGRVFFLPIMFEIILDMWISLGFVFLSKNVMFEDLFMPIYMVIVIRLINGLFERIIQIFTRRGKIHD